MNTCRHPSGPWRGAAILGLLVLFRTTAVGAEGRAPSANDLEQGATVAETYDLNTLCVIEEVSSWRPCRGKYRRALAYDDFYRSLGRPDLSDDQARRRTTVLALGGGGVVATLGGGIIFFSGTSNGKFSVQAGIGAGLVVGGIVAFFIARSLDQLPISAEEASHLAARYNVQLRARLGLTPVSVRPPTNRVLGPGALTIAPMLAPHELGLTVGMRF